MLIYDHIEKTRKMSGNQIWGVRFNACQEQANQISMWPPETDKLSNTHFTLHEGKKMGILSSSTSITQYKVNGKLASPVLETVYNGLVGNTIQDIDGDQEEKTVGWTSIKNPYIPEFDGSSFVVGEYLVFSMRLDKKTIPSQVIKKHSTLEMNKILEQGGRNYLSKNEKKNLKTHVIDVLSRKIPSTPHVYDVVWHLEDSWLWFFSSLKAANEALESLFYQSFNLRLIKLFPYTTADLLCALSDADRDRLNRLEPITFTE